MWNSENDENHRHLSDTTEMVTGDVTQERSSLNERGSRRSSRFNLPETGTYSPSHTTADDYVEITIDDRGDSEVFHGIKAVGEVDDNKSSSFSIGRNAKRVRVVLTRRPYPAGRPERPQSSASHDLKLNFVSKRDDAFDLQRLEQRFNALSVDGSLHRSHFPRCIGMNESKEFAGMLFDALARRRNISHDSITKAQLRDFWHQMTDQSSASRFQIFFDMFDRDADGRISEDEVKEIIYLSASANKLSSITERADEYARLIMEDFDLDKDGYITKENLEMILLQGQSQSVKSSGTSRNMSKLLSEKLEPTQYSSSERWYRDFQYFLMENWQRVWVMALWIGVMSGLFVYKYIQYKHRAVYNVIGPCLCIAKGAAETLKLNMALILLPVCRKTITWFRTKTKLGVALPFDSNINFHSVIAVAIAIGVGIHAISHLYCDFPRLLHATPEEYAPIRQYFGEQPKSYWHFVKEWEIALGIIMVVLMALALTLASPWFRRRRCLFRPLNKLQGFNAFWYSHHLFIIVYGCLIVHGIKLYLVHEWYKKTTWMYLAIPVTLYAGERLIKAYRSSIKTVMILKVVVYPGNVVALHLTKPEGFEYRSGQYILLNCAIVSRFEWHPFFITSAPEDDHISVHIRTLGDWTRELKTVFSEVCQPPPTGRSGLLRVDSMEGEKNPNLPTVSIDGPYGSCIQDYKEYDVVLLVGLGIGAAPMISVVKDIMNNMKTMEEEEHSLEEGRIENYALTPERKSRAKKNSFKTRRAYFYWVTREQGSFEWFKGVMSDVAEMDHKGVIEMHSYCTSVYEEGDARSALITMLQSLNHAKNGVDIVSGTRFKSHFAKPNWHEVFKRVAITHPNARVGMFYYGAPALVPELRQLSTVFTQNTTTKFVSHFDTGY